MYIAKKNSIFQSKKQHESESQQKKKRVYFNPKKKGVG